MRKKELLGKIIIFILIGGIIISVKFILAQPIKTQLTRFTIFQTENEGFRAYSINKTANNVYSRDSSLDYSFSREINRLSCDQSLDDDCDKQVFSTNVGGYGYDVVKLNDRVSYLFKGYVLYKLPSDSREPASYVRDPSLDIFVTPEQFSFNPYDNRYYPYYGDYKIGKRAPCDSGDIIRYDCPASFRTTSTEEVLYDVQFSNPFKNNPSLRMGNIAIFTTAFSNLNPALSFAKLFAQSPTFDSENSQVVTNEVFRQLLISSLYSREYFELIIDHNLWIQPSKEVGSVVFWGSSSDGRGGHNCPAGANNFPCKNEINIYGFPLAGIDGGSGYFFRNLLKNYFKGNANINLIVKISGRSGDGQVNLCFDNNLKKVYYDLLIIRDVGGGGYDVFSDGRIRLGVDTNGGPGDVKIYIYRVPFINRTCANLGYQELMNYSW